MTGATEQELRTDLLFKALASSTRREILTILATASDSADGPCCGGEVCACTFSERLGVGAPTISHHMRTLLDAGLVSAEKRGLWVYYRLDPPAFAELDAAVAKLSAGSESATSTGCSCE